ncbi:hypothetical protein [Entomobacter blattae]|uniref:hypothetical protein n=1 Tax=Entomobacter blattae TaxID=2762277 RepID=UPI00193B0AB2|nr:hypothetical protein [Entomobacter blattae]
MPPNRFHECLSALNWTGRGLACLLNCNERLVRRWGAGDVDIPKAVATWLEALASAHEKKPPPKEKHENTLSL